MTFSIYGVSRSGKDYLIKKLKDFFEAKGLTLLHINGSATLNEMAESRYSKRFKLLSDDEKNNLRIAFIEYIHKAEESNPYIVVDGHYAFYDTDGKLFSVFTEYDLKCYEKFFYLDTNPDDIVDRMRASEGEKKNTSMTSQDIRRWQNYEIDEMTKALLGDDKELHIVKYDSDFCLEYIYDAVTSDKYDSKAIAAKMIKDLSLKNTTVILSDCDKTLSFEDSTNIALEYIGASKLPIKNIFGGDRYSNYQMMLANRYYEDIGVFTDDSLKVITERITINQAIVADLKSKKNVDILAISAGNSEVWKKILSNCRMDATVLQNYGLTSKYVKYYVANLLRKQGKFVVAIGDSLLDSLMLSEANLSYLATKGYRANVEAFIRTNPQVRQLAYFEYKYNDVVTEESVLSIKNLPPSEETQALIDVCKSSSGITGKKLRDAHGKLGVLMAQLIVKDYPDDKFVVVIMMRSGLSFGLGIADALDAPGLFYDGDNKKLLSEQLEGNPQLTDYRMILCDGVINTGKSIMELANAYSEYNPIVATNVISEKYESSNMITSL